MTSVNPLDPGSPLKPPPENFQTEQAHPPQPAFPEDSAVTKAEKYERNGTVDAATVSDGQVDGVEPSMKRRKLEPSEQPVQDARDLQKGVAPVKAEFLLYPSGQRHQSQAEAADDDAAEAAHQDNRGGEGPKNKRGKKQGGQNTSRDFGSSRDAIPLCATRAHSPEFSPRECRFGNDCRFTHDLRKYLEKGKREDLKTFNKRCPVWDARGKCTSGWKCRFAGSHMEEVELEDGRKELRLVEDPAKVASQPGDDEDGIGVVNIVSTDAKISLTKKRYDTKKADDYLKWMEINAKELTKNLHGKVDRDESPTVEAQEDLEAEKKDSMEDVQENRAMYTEPPFLPSEKRRVYFGPETPVLAPLTTQGNLPFRRLCGELGAQATYSEMALSMPLISGQKGEWALMKAHESETLPPKFQSKGTVVQGYDNSKDFKFGAQIAANKPWLALKTAQVLSDLCPHLRVIDLNCGCPIDLVFRTGAGSALLDAQPKLEKILRGMNAVSGEVPITAKIRLGTRDNRPTALKLAQRLVHGGLQAHESGEGPPGIAALTLHGRSRQQRYQRSADWGYIAECASLIKRLNAERDELTDTSQEPDARSLAAAGHVYFLGNGDCYSHADYYTNIQESKVDSVMIGRGALIKPWIFEEIEANQYLDKSATERLAYVEKFAKYGLEAWGSDEMGVGLTRRFLLEWLSFAHRYVPVGILERLPPNIQDRPPAWKGRNELETLLGSDNYKDWIKISEMFLGPAHKDFKFAPKHKSHSYEIEAEG